MTDTRDQGSTSLNSNTLRPLLKRRKPINHAAVPFILCWSHKAGCTAALKWYLHHAGLLDDALRLEDPNMRLKIHSYENKVLKAQPGYNDNLIAAICAGKPLLGFMRCPFERAFSSYMILNHGWYLRMKRRGVISPGMKIRQFVVEWLHGTGAPMGSPISFRDYLLWLGRQDMAALNPHHTPQVLPLHSAVATRFFRLIDFEDAINAVEDEFGLEKSSSDREHFSSGHHRPKVEVSPTDIAAFLQERIALEAYPLQNLPKMTRQTLAGTEMETLIADLFKDDIAAYDLIAPLTGNTLASQHRRPVT